jgi:hypothetical protein
MNAVINKISHYQLGNNRAKYEDRRMFYLKPNGKWQQSGDLTLDFLCGDLSIDPIPISDEETAKLFKKLGGKGKPCDLN